MIGNEQTHRHSYHNDDDEYTEPNRKSSHPSMKSKVSGGCKDWLDSKDNQPACHNRSMNMCEPVCFILSGTHVQPAWQKSAKRYYWKEQSHKHEKVPPLMFFLN